LLLLEAIAQAPLDRLPGTWVSELGRSLRHAEERVRRQSLLTIRARGVTEFDEPLLRLAGDKGVDAELRVTALAAVAPRLAKLEPPLFDFLRSRLDKDLPPLARLAAADTLGHCKLSAEQLLALTEAVSAAGAMELPHLMAAFERSPSPEVGIKLLGALDKSPGFTSLSADDLRRTLKGYPAAIQQWARSLIARLEVDLEKMKARLDELEPAIAKGDVKRGRTVFFGKKAACSTCHVVGTEGGRVGPDLTKIGGIRAGRDLLEAVVFPSASFVRGYEPLVVATKDGRLHSGILGRDTADAIYLVNAERAETRIPRAAIETIDRGKVSIMPQGLDAQLSRQELGDLIAFLQSLR
jgi:putative heme-binding domain-containing protein